MEFKPLCETFGLHTSDVNIAKPLSDTVFAQIAQTFFRGQVLVLHDQSLTAAQYVAFARRFGPPEPHVIDQFHHADDPNILILSNRRRDGQPVGLADAGTYFHTDYSYLEVPARATMLYSIEVPKKGGDTLFANQYAAYDDLPPDLKKRLDPLVALHHYGNRDDQDKSSRTVASPLTGAQEEKVAWVKHRVA